MEPITVFKRNLQSEITWQYTGTLLERGSDFVLLEARFNRPDMPFMGVVLKQNDRFVELFYMDRWYNIFEIHDRDDDQIKGWYCNLGYPAVWDSEASISYIDLALDLWVSTGGEQFVLDQDEFEALDIAASLRTQVLAALEDLQAFFRNKERDG